MRGKKLFGTYLVILLVLSLASIKLAIASPEATIEVMPPQQVGTPNDYITIVLYITGATNVHGFEVRMSWDLSMTDFPPEVTEGNFLEQVIPTYETAGIAVKEDFAGGFIIITNNIKGNVTVDSTYPYNIMCFVTFKVADSGICNIHLFDTKLWDYDLNELPHTTVDGFFYTKVPYVDWTVTPSNPLPGEVATLNASASYDPDNLVPGADPTPGPLTNFVWDFGDGSPVEYGMVVNHTFPDYERDPYPVTLTVTDDDGEAWAKTKGLRIWRDLIMSDIWFDPTWWLDLDVRELARGANVLILVTATNVGTFTETFDIDLTMTNDLTGDPVYVEPWYGTFELAPGTGTAWGGFAGYFYTGEPAGDYTLTAEIINGPPDEPDKSNNVVSIHVRLVEADLLEASVAVEDSRLMFSGRAKNVESTTTPDVGLYTWLRFDVYEVKKGTLVGSVDTDAEFLLNGEESGVLTASMDVVYGDYTVEAYAVYSTMSPGDVSFYEQFAWPGALEGTSETTADFAIHLPGAELSMARADTRHFDISKRGDTLTFYGKAKNIEKDAWPETGLDVWIRFEVLTPDDVLVILDTSSEYILNEEETSVLTASMTVTEGTYAVTAYAMFNRTISLGEWESYSLKMKSFTVVVIP